MRYVRSFRSAVAEKLLCWLFPGSYYKIFSDSAGSFGLFQKFRGFIILGTASRNIQPY